MSYFVSDGIDRGASSTTLGNGGILTYNLSATAPMTGQLIIAITATYAPVASNTRYVLEPFDPPLDWMQIGDPLQVVSGTSNVVMQVWAARWIEPGTSPTLLRLVATRTSGTGFAQGEVRPSTYFWSGGLGLWTPSLTAACINDVSPTAVDTWQGSDISPTVASTLFQTARQPGAATRIDLADGGGHWTIWSGTSHVYRGMSPPPGVAPGTHTAGVLRTIPSVSSVWISKIWAMQGVAPAAPDTSWSLGLASKS